jgi:uncharacterized membrane protein
VLRGWLWHLPAVVGVLLRWSSCRPCRSGPISLSAYLGLSILKIRTFLEHQAHERASARTVIIEDRGPLAFLFLNNNLHVVHHMHPKLPWYRLPRIYFNNQDKYLRRNDGYRYRSYAEIFGRHLTRAKDPVPHPLYPPAIGRLRRAVAGRCSGPCPPGSSPRCFAAFMQNLRFLLQRHLKVTTLSTMGATWARFAFAMPFVALALILYASASGQVPPKPAAEFWGYITVGGIAQMLATACVVALFARRNFAVGITLKKTEVILTALIGLVVLGEGVSTPVVAAIGVGFLGVLLLSDPPKGEGRCPGVTGCSTRPRAMGWPRGFYSGFPRSATGARPCPCPGDAVLRAAVALLAATVVQTATLGLWLAMREGARSARVLAAWRVAVLTGLTSMLGSMGWFTAFALQTAAYVKALGQVELVFTFLFSVFWLKEKSSAKEIGASS